MSPVPPLDQHYTPSALARELIGTVDLNHVGRVGDFAVGDGELLRAAAERWPEAELVAADIDPQTVARLRRRYPAWSISRCDFMSARSRARARAVRRGSGFDVIALNPPFSFRGGTKKTVMIGERVVSCSPPLAFVVEAVRYLRSGGQLVAILPHGALTSEKDREARELLADHHGFEVVRTCARGTFSSCTPRTAVVRIGTGTVFDPSPLPLSTIPDGRARVGDVSMRRGRTPVGRALSSGLPLVHTTELRGGKLLPSRRFADARGATVRGPAVLLARVGKPMSSKVVLVDVTHPPVVLSDCVLAVECSTLSAARVLRRAILENWETVEAAYGGTCARYLTLASLKDLLWALGVSVLPYGTSVRAQPSGSVSGDGLASEEPSLGAISGSHILES